MHTTSSTPANTSKLPIILELLLLVGLVVAICLLPTSNKTTPAAAARTVAK